MKSSLSRLADRIQEEKWLLLVCLLLAFLAWQGIRKNTGFPADVSNVSVEVDLPPGWAVWEKSSQQVDILFRGSREDLRYLNSGQLRVVIPISSPTAGNEMHIRLEEKYLKNPTDAKVVRFSPADIFIKLDRESEVRLPVKAVTEGALPQGMEIVKVVCTPAVVRVSGAEQVLRELQNVHTRTIRLSDRQGSFKESVPIDVQRTDRIRVDPDWVSVDIQIEQHTGTRTFERIPVRVVSASGENRRIELVPQFVNVTIRGQQQRIEQIREEDVFAYVSCTDLTETGGYDLPVTVRLPAGVQLSGAEPGTIHIKLN